MMVVRTSFSSTSMLCKERETGSEVAFSFEVSLVEAELLFEGSLADADFSGTVCLVSQVHIIGTAAVLFSSSFFTLQMPEYSDNALDR